MRVAVDRGFVGAGVALLGFLGAERVRPAVPDVHLQLLQDVQGGLELRLAAETRTELRDHITKSASWSSRNSVNTLFYYRIMDGPEHSEEGRDVVVSQQQQGGQPTF